MKGAFEFGFLMMFSLPVLVFGLNFMQIVMTYNQARHLQDYAVTQIEHQNRMDENVMELIENGKQYCTSCQVTITPVSERYDVKVTFPIDITLVNYHTQGFTHSLTQIIRRS